MKYVNWLNEIRAGLLALEFYNAEQKKWGQVSFFYFRRQLFSKAHCYARYVLLRVALEAGEGFVTIEELTGDDGKPDLRFVLDRKKIDNVGKPAVNAFLGKLQVDSLCNNNNTL